METPFVDNTSGNREHVLKNCITNQFTLEQIYETGLKKSKWYGGSIEITIWFREEKIYLYNRNRNNHCYTNDIMANWNTECSPGSLLFYYIFKDYTHLIFNFVYFQNWLISHGWSSRRLAPIRNTSSWIYQIFILRTKWHKLLNLTTILLSNTL